MPELDFFSMSIVLAVDLMAIAFALPWIMGSNVSSAAKYAQRFFLLHGLSWVLFLASAHIANAIGSKAAFLAGSLSTGAALWQLGQALNAWLGPRHPALVRGLAVLCIAAPLGSMALVGLPSFGLSWLNACQGLSLLIIAVMSIKPSRSTAKGWRYIIGSASLLMTFTFLVHSYFSLPLPWPHSAAGQQFASHTFSLFTPICSTLFLVALLIAWRDESNQQLKDLELQDPLTSLPNRRALEQQGQVMLRRALREKLPLAMILLDMDHFGRVNHKHGYAVGDEALQLLSRTLQKQMRGDEVAARWSSEAFCLLVFAQADGVQSLCARLQSALQLGAQYELQVNLDFSAGCALVPQVWSDLTLSGMAQQAEIALQEAKRLGRGRWEFATLQAPVVATPAI